jgi:hypothetical protein
MQVLSCADSPLSVTGNIIGILTLVYAVILTLYLYASQLADVEDDVRRFSHDLETETQWVGSTIHKLEDKFGDIPQESRDRLENTLNQFKKLVNESEALLAPLLLAPFYYQSESTSFYQRSERSKWSLLVMRGRFIAKKAEMEAMLKRVADMRGNVDGIYNALIQRYVR